MISTLSNLIPQEFVSIWDALKRGDLDRAREIQGRIVDVEELVIPGWNSSWEHAGKYILKKRGMFSSAVVSSPLPTMSEVETRKLETKGRELGLF
jgi:dihydrodipicolinate synthase/N-acetylneuraminate lyase